MNKLFKDIRHSDVDAVRAAISKNIAVVNEVYTAKAPKKILDNRRYKWRLSVENLKS